MSLPARVVMGEENLLGGPAPISTMSVPQDMSLYKYAYLNRKLHGKPSAMPRG